MEGRFEEIAEKGHTDKEREKNKCIPKIIMKPQNPRKKKKSYKQSVSKDTTSFVWESRIGNILQSVV